MLGGRIVRCGGPEIAEELEDVGYDELRREFGADEPDSDALADIL